VLRILHPNRMNIIDIDKTNSIKQAAKILDEGGILVFPTDTVYGIGCFLDEKAIKKLYRIKNRPLSQPTAILMSVNLFQKKFSGKIDLKSFWNGKLTLLLPRKSFDIDIPKILVKDEKIGIRLPQYRWLKTLIDLTGPIVASSANKKGEKPPAEFADINSEIIEEIDLVIRTREKLPGIPSRVYDLKLKKYLR
jgi:L-threonylcarbamoyladenylate synthase